MSTEFKGHKVKPSWDHDPQVGDRILMTRNMQTMMYSDDRINLKQGVITAIHPLYKGGEDLYWIKLDGKDTSSGYGKYSFKILVHDPPKGGYV